MRDSASKSWMVEETFLSQASTSVVGLNYQSSSSSLKKVATEPP